MNSNNDTRFLTFCDDFHLPTLWTEHLFVLAKHANSTNEAQKMVLQRKGID